MFLSCIDLCTVEENTIFILWGRFLRSCSANTDRIYHQSTVQRPVHTGILTRKKCRLMGTYARCRCSSIYENTEKANIKEDINGRLFLLFLPLSIFFSNTPIPFNLAFILPHSQYHLQSVSTLQHFHCVSHLSLSQLLTLLFPSSDTE